ncbi:hypothetical protein Taro_017355 [Colocasia esculenta]|uniref:THO complex subunit 2 N-terminal domain-containing protein n=1 Tax=Colocasia esculenta TaxID=4460 RepID=A0A843USZ0_COLES|nr:hypothetical protein [Colocasia esculenta]
MTSLSSAKLMMCAAGSSAGQSTWTEARIFNLLPVMANSKPFSLCLIPPTSTSLASRDKANDFLTQLLRRWTYSSGKSLTSKTFLLLQAGTGDLAALLTTSVKVHVALVPGAGPLDTPPYLPARSFNPYPISPPTTHHYASLSASEEFLSESELSKIKAQDLKAKEVRVNTRLLYQQTKFNLLREESEGYAKLVTLLCHSGLVKTDHASATTISIIKVLLSINEPWTMSLVDQVLECFELHPDCNIFYDLIPMFPKSHASQILGFKFQYYQRMEVNNVVPFGLYRLTALLIKAELIDLDSMVYRWYDLRRRCGRLVPPAVVLLELCELVLPRGMPQVNKIGKINLAATGKDLTDEEKPDFTVDLFSALDMEAKAVSERAQELDNNQSLVVLST